MKGHIRIIFATVALWMISSTEGIHSRGNQEKSDPSPSMVTGNRHASKKTSTQENGECDAVNDFTWKFTNAVLSSNKWARIFNTSLSPREAEAAYQRIVFSLVDNVHVQNPRAVAKTMSKAIRATFGNLTLTKYAESYGYSAASYLKSKDVLTCENLDELSDVYVRFIKQAARNVPDIPDPRDSFIQAALDGGSHFLTSVKQFNADTVGPIARNYAHTLYLLTGVPETPPVDPHCNDFNVIDKFTSRFTDIILSKDKLSDIFDVSLSPEEAAAAYERIVFNAVKYVNTGFPRAVSRIVSNAILATYGHLTLKTLVQAYGRSVATHLKSRNILTCENLNDLCDAYASYVKQAVRYVPHIPDRSIAFIQAAYDGLFHFMASMDLFTAESVAFLAQDFANSLYFLAGVPQNGDETANVEKFLDVEDI